MIPQRPLLLITLPSIALVLGGLVYFRRKKKSTVKEKSCDSGGDTNKHSQHTADKTEETQAVHSQPLHSQSRPISQQSSGNNKKSPGSCKSQSPSSSNSSLDNKLGKSAPIDIAPNPRSPPKRLTEEQIDSEFRKLKLQDVDYKNLLSIEEQEDLDNTPADSPFYQKKFLFEKSEPKVEPVVVKASMAAKLSPEFAHSEYTRVESDDEAHRDSANTSPISEEQEVEDVSVVAKEGDKEGQTRNAPVASPPLSLCSMHSGDSGKGSSSPHSIGEPASAYDFMIQQNLIGHLIGRNGQFVNMIKVKSGANVTVKRHPTSKRAKICTVEGQPAEIEAALKMIRLKLPQKKYPYFSTDRLYLTADNQVVAPFEASNLHLHLLEAVNNAVTSSSIVSGGHLFLQQPLHPSYPSLNLLQKYMNVTYSMSEAPQLPEVIDDAICVVSVMGNWYRVQILSHNPQTLTCLVKYLDYGGYVSVLASELRQIRTDFMNVPFQAVECLLSNIRPKDGEWCKEAADTLQSLTHNVIMQAQVAGYSQDNLPEVLLFVSIAKDNVLFVNQELVARGLAEWVEETPEAVA